MSYFDFGFQFAIGLFCILLLARLFGSSAFLVAALARGAIEGVSWTQYFVTSEWYFVLVSAVSVVGAGLIYWFTWEDDR